MDFYCETPNVPDQATKTIKIYRIKIIKKTQAPRQLCASFSRYLEDSIQLKIADFTNVNNMNYQQ